MMDDLLPDIKRLFTKDEDFFAPFGRDGSTHPRWVCGQAAVWRATSPP